MQAGAGLHVLDRNPDQVRDVLRAIQATSRESLDGLRAELAHMRGEVDPARRPHPVLRDVSVLVDRVRSGGLDVRLEIADHVPAVSDEVGAAAYRIVQEALTNALRHAGSFARAQVRISEVRGSCCSRSPTPVGVALWPSWKAAASGACVTGHGEWAAPSK